MEPRSSLPRWLTIALFAAAIAALVWIFRAVVTPCLFAFLLAYALDPAVDALERRGISRTWGITLIFSSITGVAIGFVMILLPRIAHDVTVFLRDLPTFLTSTFERASPLLSRAGISQPHSAQELASQLSIDVHSVAQNAVKPAGAAMQWLIGGTASVVSAIVAALIVPVLAFYFLLDFDIIVAQARDMVPYRWRESSFSLASEIDDVVSQFLRGQLLVMAALAVAYSLVYSIVGVRLALAIGALAGLLAFIPYVGSASALVLALLMTLLDWHGWGPIIGVVVGHTIVQLLEGFVITPRIMGEKIGLSSVWVMLAIMAAGAVGGFLGVLLAVPLAAVIKIFIVRGYRVYKRSHFYNEGRALDSMATVTDTGVVRPSIPPLAIDDSTAPQTSTAVEHHVIEEEPPSSEPKR